MESFLGYFRPVSDSCGVRPAPGVKPRGALEVTPRAGSGRSSLISSTVIAAVGSMKHRLPTSDLRLTDS